MIDNKKLREAIVKMRAKASTLPPELVDLVRLLDERARENFKGDKGDTGSIGPAGKSIRGEVGATGSRGEKGETGDRGADSTIPGPRGEKGDAGPIGKSGENGKDGRDGIEITPDQIVEKLQSLKGTDRLDVTAIKGLDKIITSLQQAIKEARKHGGGSQGGGTAVEYYDLSPFLDGATKRFTIASTYRIRKIVQVTSSSEPFTFRPVIDYTFTGTDIIFDAAIDAPTQLRNGQSIILLVIH